MMHNPHCRRQTASDEKGRIGSILRHFAVMLMASLFPFLANADSAVVRAQERQGPFTITIFAPAEISLGLPTDITVMVQRHDSVEVVMDADVELGLVPPVGASFSANDLVCGFGNGVPAGLRGGANAFVATHTQAVNKLLYGSSVVFSVGGNWQLRATVRHGNEAANASCVLPVSPSPSRFAAVWPCFALPPLAIAVFGCNQWLRNRRGRNLSEEFGS
jgi:hypothetical protein